MCELRKSDRHTSVASQPLCVGYGYSVRLSQRLDMSAANGSFSVISCKDGYGDKILTNTNVAVPQRIVEEIAINTLQKHTPESFWQNFTRRLGRFIVFSHPIIQICCTCRAFIRLVHLVLLHVVMTLLMVVLIVYLVQKWCVRLRLLY